MLKQLLFLSIILLSIPCFGQNADSVRTILSIEYGKFQGKSQFDLTTLKKTESTITTDWQCYGLRVHQELNQVFQVNSGVLFQTLKTNSIPQLTYDYSTNRSYSRDKISFVNIPIGLGTMFNLYKRKMYLGLEFSLNLNYLSANFDQFAVDYYEFQNNRFGRAEYLVTKDFYFSQDIGINLNYFLMNRIRMRLSYSYTIENSNHIILSRGIDAYTSAPETTIFDGTGAKLSFQLGYTLFKNKSFMETKHDSDSALSNLL